MVDPKRRCAYHRVPYNTDGLWIISPERDTYGACTN
jgi:hypothetical protein